MDEDHLQEAIRYVELNPFRAKIESEVGTYSWSSVMEHLGTRSQYYLNKLPSYLQIENWWEYLTEQIAILEVFKDKWESIKTATIRNRPIGNDDFITKIENQLGKLFKLNPRGRPSKSATIS